jgi:hypothetical protein
MTTVRRMKIVRAPGTNDKPMIRIQNRFLSESGFVIRDTFDVTYQSELITIQKIKL